MSSFPGSPSTTTAITPLHFTVNTQAIDPELSPPAPVDKRHNGFLGYDRRPGRVGRAMERRRSRGPCSRGLQGASITTSLARCRPADVHREPIRAIPTTCHIESGHLTDISPPCHRQRKHPQRTARTRPRRSPAPTTSPRTLRRSPKPRRRRKRKRKMTMSPRTPRRSSRKVREMDTHTRDRPTGRRRPSHPQPAQHRFYSHDDVFRRGSKQAKLQDS